MFRQRKLDQWDDGFRRLVQEPCEHVAATGYRPVVGSSKSEADDLSAERILETGFGCLKRGRHGYFLFNRNDVYIGRSLDVYGEYSEGEVATFERIVGEGDVVIEAGASIGAHTVPLAKRVGPRGAVYALEPQRLAFQTLCANVALNSLTNVACQNVAAGAEPGEIVVPQLNPGREINFGGLALGQYTQGERRAVVPLDQLGLSRCRLLKIDVEGMELAVLKGAGQLIRECQPVLYVENDREEHSVALIRHIEALGYRLWWHLPPLFNPHNYFGNPDNIFGRVLSVNMLCIPAGQELDTTGMKGIDGPESRWRDAL